jgi:hypothetical protein
VYAEWNTIQDTHENALDQDHWKTKTELKIIYKEEFQTSPNPKNRCKTQKDIASIALIPFREA